ncbi:MAG: peptidase M3, partial [Lachnospiraceae bacterium]|nr:peptidase M3 [Lachnospiraceae bacterium]
TKEDAAQFSALVKEYIAPLGQELYSAYYNKFALAEYAKAPTMEEGIPYLRAALEAEFPPAMIEALDYMLEHNLYIFDDDVNMMPAGFSTILTEYAAPFLFINTSVYTDPSTLFHEFGHYYNFYLMGHVDWYDSNNLDLAEIHSQGLELLMFEYYEEIYGEKYANTLQVQMLSNLLDTILMGCCEDEFQQKVFENPDMTIDEMNQIHGQLYQEYMGYPVFYEWVDIHHHFETPFYYISYATSAASAFEIWELSQISRPAALSAYRSITQNTVNSGYLEPLERAGLSNPFTSDMVIELTEMVRERFLSEAQ